MPMFPLFRVRQIQGDPPRLVGTLSDTRYGSEIWVQDGGMGDLRVGDRFVTGRWSRAGAEWAFSPESKGALELIGTAREFRVFDGYWGERAQLVLDGSLRWSKTIWAKSTDHDHCRLCWADINSEVNTSHYEADPQLRVCPACYDFYIAQRSIDFSGLGGPAA